MNIAITLQHLFPDSIDRVDWSVVDDGDGPKIAEWNLSEPKPTTTELQAAWAEANEKHQWVMIRNARRPLLEESDWTHLADAPLTKAKKDKWKTYRQSLRDITKQADPNNIDWPIAPEA
jgi:hypothetical protein